ncbi:TetR family transcriptional regulator [Saccharothrix longispora]|uniref:TetR family transcriptional regulator n=1 Tax=Saccharothrix longispora TaxID=33920 RepID=UPI0028FD4924|nr:TetR family transcriptional regulator [Saccharothrix longispora]MBY8847531.1 TetR family transcriptional regulator [Saccharothrix sp. MB29]MDU0293682.1 TetR family transcriptional regulator [Saccharothrix longispora]
MTELTRALLLAAADLVAARGSRGLRMADVASRAGVSRQTVYNEFGNKDRLVQAVALFKAGEFLDGMRERFRAAPDPVEGLRLGLGFAFALAVEDPLARSVFTGANAEDLLPLLTTRGQPVLALATSVFAQHIGAHWPALPAARVRLTAETVVRLALSHLLTPSRHFPPGSRRVEAVVAVAEALLGEPSPAGRGLPRRDHRTPS